MIDLDQAELQRVAKDISRHGMHDGQKCCAVPLALLDRLISSFDCDHLIRDPRGNRLPR